MITSVSTAHGPVRARAWAIVTALALVAASVLGGGSTASAADPLVVSLTGSGSLGGTLTAVATGGEAPVQFAWSKNGNATVVSRSNSYFPTAVEKGDQLTVTASDGVATASASVFVTGGSISLSNRSVPTGSEVVVTGSFFAPGVVYGVQSGELFSTNVTADAQGAFAVSVPVGFGDAATVTVTSSAGRVANLTVAVTGPPTLTGVTPWLAEVRAGKRASVDTGAWTESAELSYQWYLGADPIPGAVYATYVPNVRQVGKALSVRITGTSGRMQLVAASNAQKVLPAAFTKKPRVRISGVARAGSVVTVVTRGGWRPLGVKTTTRWYLDGEKIAGAKRSKLTVKAEWAGKKLSVQVTGTKRGYQTTTVTKVSRVGR